jgi:hypothetical protein
MPTPHIAVYTHFTTVETHYKEDSYSEFLHLRFTVYLVRVIMSPLIHIMRLHSIYIGNVHISNAVFHPPGN